MHDPLVTGELVMLEDRHVYGTPTEERVAAGYAAAPLEVLRFQSAREYRAGGG